MCLCNKSCMSVWPAGQSSVRLAWPKRLKRWTVLLFQPNDFQPAMIIGTIDLYYFIPLSLTLTLARGHKISAKHKPHGFIFSHTFQLIRMKSDMVLKQFKLNSLTLLLNEIERNKGNNCCFTDLTKTNNNSKKKSP